MKKTPIYDLPLLTGEDDPRKVLNTFEELMWDSSSSAMSKIEVALADRDVVEVNSAASLPASGKPGKVYVTTDDNKAMRWNGIEYVELSAKVPLGEAEDTAYRGDRGKVAYDHSQSTGNPHGTTPQDIGAEPAIASGSAAQYLSGDKTWRSFDADVRGATLAGITMVDHSAVSDTDTVLDAVGKLQAQTDMRTNKTVPSASGNIAALAADGSLIDGGKTVAQLMPPDASSALPLAAGIAAAGTNNGKYAREGHVHPTTVMTITDTLSTSWSGSATPYTQVRSVAGILASDTPFIDVAPSAAASTGMEQIENWGKVSRAVTANGSITFYCYDEKPTGTIPIQIKVVR